jgi:hypothetical protein
MFLSKTPHDACSLKVISHASTRTLTAKREHEQEPSRFDICSPERPRVSSFAENPLPLDLKTLARSLKLWVNTSLAMALLLLSWQADMYAVGLIV